MMPMGARPGSRAAWSWSEQHFAPVDLAVQTLVRDGMGVPPFDTHPDGDGTLRARGLTAEDWRAWVAALVVLHAEMRTLALTSRSMSPDERASRRWAPPDGLAEPWTLCPGSEELRARLREMFIEPPKPGDLADPVDTLLHGQRVVAPHAGASAQRRLWRDLSSFADRLPSLVVLLVHYPGPVILPVPPTTCLVAPAHDADAYADQLRLAVRMLTDRPQ
jgi:hypothetical protein